MRATDEPQALPLCASDTLAERGRAWLWDVDVKGRPARAFVLRFDGEVHAYLNRCVHVPAELDWLPGEFFSADGQAIVCSIHGATYDPADGRCLGGRCGHGRLTALTVRESGGQVYWYPSCDIRPATSAPAATADESPP